MMLKQLKLSVFHYLSYSLHNVGWLAFIVTVSLLFNATVKAEPVARNKDTSSITDASLDYLKLQSKYRLEIGFFWIRSDTSAYYSKFERVASLIDFEESLGIDDDKLVPFASFRWRFSPRWTLDISYFKFDRSGTDRLVQEIEWDDTIYSANSVIYSRFNMSDIRASINYSFFQRKDKELGAGFGLHRMEVDTQISEVNIGKERADVWAPLPVATFYSSTALTEVWTMMLRLDWLKLKHNGFDGELRSFGLDFMYGLTKSFEIGFGFRTVRLDLDYDSDDYSAGLHMDIRGPAGFVRYNF